MDIMECLRTAKLQLQAAECRFNNATTKDDIDVAIAEMNAAEKRFNRLLKLIKEKAS